MKCILKTSNSNLISVSSVLSVAKNNLLLRDLADKKAFKSDQKMKKDVVSTTKNMKNKANCNHSNITATPCNIGTYNDLQPKTKNGTKPNKANFFTASNPLFSSSLWPSVFLFFLCGKVVKLKKLFFAKRTQFRQPNSTANSCNKVTYNALQPKGNEPKRTQLKPIKPNPNPISKPQCAQKKTTIWPSYLFVNYRLQYSAEDMDFFALKLDYTLFECKQGKIIAHPHIETGMPFRSALADNDRPCLSQLAAIKLYTAILRITVSTVPRRTLSLFMCHCLPQVSVRSIADITVV